MIRLWWRHLFTDCARITAAILMVLSSLYIIVDYSVHGKLLTQGGVGVSGMLVYYGALIAYHAPFLLPLALLLGTMRSLLTLNLRRELLALKAGGMSNWALISPYLALGLLVACTLLANYQFVYPKACQICDQIASEVIGKRSGSKGPSLRALALKDGSKLLYQRYDPARRLLFDTLWIRLDGSIYRAKYLDPHSDQLNGWWVDYLSRTESGALALQESWQNVRLPDMGFDLQADLQMLLTAPDALSLTALFHRLPSAHHIVTDRNSELIAYFHSKLALPWVGLIMLLCISPYCMQFSRQTPLFVIYGVAIMGFLSLQTVLDVSLILAKSHLISASWAAWSPLGLIAVGSLLRWLKMS